MICGGSPIARDLSPTASPSSRIIPYHPAHSPELASADSVCDPILCVRAFSGTWTTTSSRTSTPRSAPGAASAVWTSPATATRCAGRSPRACAACAAPWRPPARAESAAGGERCGGRTGWGHNIIHGQHGWGRNMHGQRGSGVNCVGQRIKEGARRRGQRALWQGCRASGEQNGGPGGKQPQVEGLALTEEGWCSGGIIIIRSLEGAASLPLLSNSNDK